MISRVLLWDRLGWGWLKFSNGNHWKNAITSLGIWANPANIQFPQKWLRFFPFSLMRVAWGCKTLQSFWGNPRGSFITTKAEDIGFMLPPKHSSPCISMSPLLLLSITGSGGSRPPRCHFLCLTGIQDTGRWYCLAFFWISIIRELLVQLFGGCNGVLWQWARSRCDAALIPPSFQIQRWEASESQHQANREFKTLSVAGFQQYFNSCRQNYRIASKATDSSLGRLL